MSDGWDPRIDSMELRGYDTAYETGWGMFSKLVTEISHIAQRPPPHPPAVKVTCSIASPQEGVELNEVKGEIEKGFFDAKVRLKADIPQVHDAFRWAFVTKPGVVEGVARYIPESS